MMTPTPRGRSFVRRLITLAVTICAIAVAVVCATWITTNLAWARRLVIESSLTQAQIIAIHSAAAMSFDDPAAARETLGALRADPNVTAAALYTPAGALFAEYRSDPAHATPGPLSLAGAYRISGRTLTLTRPVLHGNQTLGTLVIAYDLGGVYAHVEKMVGWSVLAGALATALAVLLAVRLYRSLARGIVELVDAARAVSETRDFSIRARKVSDDELGLVADAFNDMLLRIEQQAADLQKAHQLFRIAVESAPCGVLMADTQERIVLVNDRVESMLGYRPGELVGEPASRIIHGGLNAAPHVVSAGADPPVDRRDRTAVREGGEEVAIELGISPVITDRGPMLLAYMVDITQRKQWESALVRLNRELEQRSREMEQFVYTVSHDLRSPLVTTLGFAGLLEEDLRGGRMDEVHEAVQHITQAGRRMSQLIDDLLQFSRLGRVQLHPERIDVRELVAGLAVDLRERLESSGCTLEVEPGTPPIWMDRRRLVQVLDNLLINAMKYGSKGTDKKITVGGDRTGEETRLFVRDRGPGIDPEYHDKVFGMFQRLQTGGEGTGIGLTIVQRIAILHGGRAWVESTPGHGATFWIAVPAHNPSENPSPLHKD